MTGNVDLALRRLRYELRTVAADYPALYLLFARRAHAAGPGKVLGRDTELVIEGFTRSGTTFAVVAFQLAQARPVRVARHLHASAHVIAAARRGLSTLVCARPPEPTVLAQVIREPHVTLAQSLRSFARFYERISPYRARFVIATFEQVTGDFGGVIAAVNARFKWTSVSSTTLGTTSSGASSSSSTAPEAGGCARSWATPSPGS